ncbi:MAG TPA: nucleotide exchange factor GrpE [Actinomycetaceae bacterium]|nr:nucleotide exchange factor GrpE [Actinomycetaceae bacterium]
MTENHEEPIIHDKRRLDPETGRLRKPLGETTAASAAGAAGAAPAGQRGAGGSGGGTGTGGASGDPAAAEAGTQGGDQPGGEGNLAGLKAENAKLADELARANAAYYNLSQEYTNFVRRSKELAVVAQKQGVERVANALLGVLDDVELARQHNELTGPLGSMAERFESLLTTNFDLQRYGVIGEEFDPEIHDALMDMSSDEVTTPTIAQVIQPGYRIGDKVLRAARVAVNSPA